MITNLPPPLHHQHSLPPPKAKQFEMLGFVCSVIKKCFKLKCGSGGEMV